jgi:DNA invertase Pin-like site-specific DNA recombinase
MTRTYGYVRVSSIDQNEERQIIAMQKQQVPEECIFCPRIYAFFFLLYKKKKTKRPCRNARPIFVYKSCYVSAIMYQI